MTRAGTHAVVLGASMGGLLAARAVADCFERVTLIEKDHFPAFGQPRKGVPQGNHTHGLLAGGLRALEEFFPGLSRELATHGAQLADMGQGTWVIEGRRLCLPPTVGIPTVTCRRPVLEAQVCRRLLQLPNVEAINGCDALGLPHRDGRVTAVKLRQRDSGVTRTLDADLVVDATGRGSRLTTWLEELNYPVPSEDRVRIDLGYVTAVCRKKASFHHHGVGLVIASKPPNPRCGVALAVDDEHWIVTLVGYFGESPQATHAGMLDFAQLLPAPDMHALLQQLDPVGEIVSAKFPHSQRRHYERLARHPEGVVAFGDALCSFNPIFGQGMTVAALEAQELAKALEHGVPGLWRRFYKKASRVANVPWSTAVGNDMRFEQVEGRRGLATRFINGYLIRLLEVASRDPHVGLAFLRMTNMLEPPSTLFGPAIMRRVIFGGASANDGPVVQLSKLPAPLVGVSENDGAPRSAERKTARAS